MEVKYGAPVVSRGDSDKIPKQGSLQIKGWSTMELSPPDEGHYHTLRHLYQGENQYGEPVQKVEWEFRVHASHFTTLANLFFEAVKYYRTPRESEALHALGDSLKMLAALKPFAELERTGFKGSVYEGLADETIVNINHASGVVVRRRDYMRALETYDENIKKVTPQLGV